MFNFDELGMVRVDGCGSVIWRLPLRTHHSLVWDAASRSFWTSSIKQHNGTAGQFPNHREGFIEYAVVEVSSDGRILQQMSLNDLLTQNGMAGLLYLSTTNNRTTAVGGDTLHVNDVERFPADMEPGYFTPGDIMVSIRNINAVVVFENESMAVKFISIGQVIRHHDPDFVDGDTISIFDNNNLQPLVEDGQSRIVRVDVPSGELVVTFTGTAARPFFTDIMGKHQLLDNGNLLITESRAGRALEISAQGNLVWEYNNVVRQDVVGLLSEAQRLDQRFDRSFFERLAAACPAP